jgi:hypothetical protein
MVSTIEIDETTLGALRESPTYKIQDRYGVYVAVQNPWKEPTELQTGGITRASLLNADDWLVAQSNFLSIPTPKLEVYTNAQWQEIATLNEWAPEPVQPTPTADWNTPPAGSTPPPWQPAPGPQYAAPYGPPVSPPGYGFAITGIVLIFFAPLIGLIFSIIARKKMLESNSYEAMTLAKVGIIVNAVLTGLTALMMLFAVIIGIAGVSSYDDTANSNYGYQEPAMIDEY